MDIIKSKVDAAIQIPNPIYLCIRVNPSVSHQDDDTSFPPNPKLLLAHVGNSSHPFRAPGAVLVWVCAESL